MHARRRNRDPTRQPTTTTTTTANKKLAARTAAACLAAMAACCAPRLGEAFLPPPPPAATFTAPTAAATTAAAAAGGRYGCRLASSRSKQRPASFSTGVWQHPRVGGAGTEATTAMMMMMAAKGFGKSAEPSPATSTGDKGATDAAGRGRQGDGDGGGAGGAATAKGGGVGEVGSWEKEYKAYIKRTGQYLCSMSWEGHEEMGRGAIFANYDDARAGGKLNEADKFGGIPSMYVPLTEFESMREAQKPGEEDDLAQIVRRVQDYRPEKEFVVVFQAAGVMGADIVRPNVTPPEMAKHVVKSDGVSTLPSASGLDGVIDVN